MAEPVGLKFSKTHEWVRVEGDVATIGITEHAEEELGDVALVLFPEIGRVLHAEQKFGEIESIKAVSDLNSPVAGKVIAVNETLTAAPETVNDDPYGLGWMIQVELTHLEDLDTLMDSAAYDQYLQES